MRLILMRHAKAISRDPHIFTDDSRRPLSDKGIEEHNDISKVLLDMDIIFDHILTSPFERAKETAKITKKVYGFKEKKVKLDELADSFSVRGLLKKIGRYKDDETLLLVGHEPYMSVLANALLCPEAPMQIDFKKSAVMCISFLGRPEVGQGTLEYFLRPGLLRNIRKDGDGKAKRPRAPAEAPKRAFPPKGGTKNNKGKGKKEKKKGKKRKRN